MRDHTVTSRPVCRWVAVTDEQGRTRMEAHWSTPDALSTSHAA
ncbi:MAG: hypothetical protein ACI379_12845 [Nocardioides sp.]